MPRIADTERIRRLLESEGGSLSRREIIEQLGLTDERYDTVAGQLCSEEIAVRNRGRAGGLSLVAAAAPARQRRAGRDSTEVPLERELYPPFERYLLKTAAQRDESKAVVLNTHMVRGAKWEAPDLTEARITPFPMIGQWEFRIAAYELKRQGCWSVDSLLQAAMYSEFAHETWLVVPTASFEEDWVEYFGQRVVTTAVEHGVGLGTFDPKARVLRKHTAARQHRPTLARQHEWLETTIYRIGAEELKAEIAGHIAWAARKAAAGRD